MGGNLCLCAYWQRQPPRRVPACTPRQPCLAAGGKTRSSRSFLGLIPARVPPGGRRPARTRAFRHWRRRSRKAHRPGTRRRASYAGRRRRSPCLCFIPGGRAGTRRVCLDPGRPAGIDRDVDAGSEGCGNRLTNRRMGDRDHAD